MKKAAILTYFNVHNHGSSLQAYSAKKVLEDYGFDVTYLTFDRNYDFISLKQSNKYSISLKSIPLYFSYLLKRGLGNFLFNLKKRKMLNRFSKEYLGKQIRYSDFNGDLVLIGSDEVFSTEIGLNPFFYGYGLQSKKVISYAASFGPTTMSMITDRRLGGIICGITDSIDQISVRDQNSFDIIKNITGISPKIVCDPVLLYGYKDELSKVTREINKKYLVIYSYDKNMNDKKTIYEIRSLAKKNGLLIVSVGYHHKWADRSINVDPFRLLGIIKNAEIVLTDTFHGAVISLIANTNFVARLSGNQNKLKFLLQQHNLENRIVSDFSNVEYYLNNSIDYEKVNQIIESNRESSRLFIDEAVKFSD